MQYGPVTHTRDDWSQAAGWYPDVAAAGDASRAWQAEFDRLGVPLRVRQQEGVDARRATVENGELRASLLLSPRKRLFRLALCTGRTRLLKGFAPDLATAADAARLWLSRTRPGHVAAVWPFLGSVALAEARERGDDRESSWLWLYENHCAELVASRLSAFVALAFHQPQLRALRPFTSHWTLRFSRTPRWPYNSDHPTVTPVEAPGKYLVGTRDGRTYDETDAADALSLVLAELPD